MGGTCRRCGAAIERHPGHPYPAECRDCLREEAIEHATEQGVIPAQ